MTGNCEAVVRRPTKPLHILRTKHFNVKCAVCFCCQPFKKPKSYRERTHTHTKTRIIQQFFFTMQNMSWKKLTNRLKGRKQFKYEWLVFFFFFFLVCAKFKATINNSTATSWVRKTLNSLKSDQHPMEKKTLNCLIHSKSFRIEFEILPTNPCYNESSDCY